MAKYKDKHAATKSKKTKLLIIGSLFIVLIGICLYFVGYYAYQVYQVNHEVKQETKLTKQVVKKTKKSTTTHLGTSDEGSMDINWEKLKRINPNIKAWIYIPQTRINYVVLQGADNTFYLHHDETDKASTSGQLFFDYRQKPNFSEKNSFIYGHDMFDGSRFTDLVKYADKDYFNAHRKVYVYTRTKRYDGTVFATQSNSGTSKAHTMSFSNSAEMTDYIDYMKSRSDVQANDVATSSISKLLTLWTCTGVATVDDAGQPVSADKSRTFVSVSLKEHR